MAGLKSILVDHTVIGLDTNPFIYLFEHHSIYFPLVEILFDYLKSPGIQGITSAINQTLAKRAIQLRAVYDLRVPDALQISAALDRGATIFVTNDHRFRKVTETKILILDDYIS